MTRDTQSIDALIEAVRGGAISTSLIEDAMDTSWEAVMVLAAFDGAMDAALGLLGHLLPSWDFSVATSWDAYVKASVSKAGEGSYYAESGTAHVKGNPARALLLATLKAWKETMK